jgi:hypothetical protein
MSGRELEILEHETHDDGRRRRTYRHTSAVDCRGQCQLGSIDGRKAISGDDFGHEQFARNGLEGSAYGPAANGSGTIEGGHHFSAQGCA